MACCMSRGSRTASASSDTPAPLMNHSRKDGNWFAALIANNPRIVRTFSDHDEVVAKLVEAGQLDTLSFVASSGYLDATQATHYRMAFKQASAC